MVALRPRSRSRCPDCATMEAVATIGGHELVVAPALDDPTAVHDEDLIGVAHGRQAVGDDDDGATRRQAGQGPMNVPLGGGSAWAVASSRRRIGASWR